MHWHHEPIAHSYVGFDALVLANHEINFRLWHEEDQARDPAASDARVAAVKRAIDGLNQRRSHSIEQIDDAIAQCIPSANEPALSAPMNTETPGSAIDRLSILALRIFHLAEESNRAGISDEVRQRVTVSWHIAQQQQANLAKSLQQLIDELNAGTKRHQTFRQLKVYNDPELNPVIYKSKPSHS